MQAENDAAFEESMRMVGKFALGVVALVGITAAAASAASSGSSFGSTPNPSSGGDRWTDKETGETFDYDPRS